jgi:uncharacterized protein YfbU (UPF0304 family)
MTIAQTLLPELDRETATDSVSTWRIHWRYTGVFPEPEEDTSPIVQEIADFLHMWSCIEAGFEALDASGQMAFRADPDLVPPVFQGFDGTREGEYQGTARYMIEHLECFAAFAGRDLEAHHPVVADYRRILKAFNPVWEPIDGARTLTLNELRMVLAYSA